MVQMRDLMANTDPVLLIATMTVSFLHMVFEYLAFKVEFTTHYPHSPFTQYLLAIHSLFAR